MAISASADSDTRSFAATSENKRFSFGVGLAVIDGAVDFSALSVIARQRLLRQNADTSLSCPHSNNDPTRLVDVSDDGVVLIASTNSLRPDEYLLGVGLPRMSAGSSGRTPPLANINQRPP
jgi:hypothetical protein